MKPLYLLLPLFALLEGCQAIATEHYTRAAPLTENEKAAFDCEDLAREENAVRIQIGQLGEVKTSEQVISGLGMATAVLRASLGGFNSQDLSFRANVKAKTDAIRSANLRLNEIKALRESKQCPNPYESENDSVN